MIISQQPQGGATGWSEAQGYLWLQSKTEFGVYYMVNFLFLKKKKHYLKIIYF